MAFLQGDVAESLPPSTSRKQRAGTSGATDHRPTVSGDSRIPTDVKKKEWIDIVKMQ